MVDDAKDKKKSEATVKVAVRSVGRPRFPIPTTDDVQRLRAEGLSMEKIARKLDSTVAVVRYRLNVPERPAPKPRKKE